MQYASVFMAKATLVCYKYMHSQQYINIGSSCYVASNIIMYHAMYTLCVVDLLSDCICLW